MRARAFAKINLSLRVLGVRADGYHELRTVFQSIDLHDTLIVRRARGPFAVSCDDPVCPSDEENLVWRAAQEVWRTTRRGGMPHGVQIHIVKRIPMRAGLGGGSSDAAAALRVFGRLWRVSAPRLRAIGASLGADIPYFFEGGTVLGLERGDLLFPLLDRPASWVVLAVPLFGVSTAEAFGWFDRDGREAVGQASRGHAAGRERVRVPRHVLLRDLERANDLEAPVAARHPEISALVRRLTRAGSLQAAMSGSGSAVFGLFDSRRHASTAAVELRRTESRVVLTRTIDRRAYQRLAGK